MKMNLGNKGELTTQQIVLLVILIASFAIILFFLFRLDLGNETQKQICHNSVLQQDKGILESTVTGGTPNLDCKTNYLCISSDSRGDCQDINPTETIEIETNNKNEVFNALANEMSDCWWQFGEGEVDYTDSDYDGLDDRVCALCSIVSFDSSLRGSLEAEEVNYGEFYGYLANTMKDESETYLQYLYEKNGLEEIEGDELSKVIDLNENYYVVTLITGEGFIQNIAVSILGMAGEDAANLLDSDKISLPTAIVNKQELDELGCTEFVTKA